MPSLYLTRFYISVQPVNWSIPSIDFDPITNTPFKPGGFLPFGVNGIFKGAAICTFIFIGFDVLLMANNSVSKTITYVGAVSFGIAFVALICCSVILTLMSPFNQLVSTHNYYIPKFQIIYFYFRHINNSLKIKSICVPTERICAISASFCRRSINCGSVDRVCGWHRHSSVQVCV